MTSGVCMQQLSVWVGTGIVIAGVSAALLAGAGTASADTESGSEGGTNSSGSTSADGGKPDSTSAKKDPTSASAGQPDSASDDKKDEAKDDESTSEPTDPDEDAKPNPVKPTATITKKKSAAAEPVTEKSAVAAEPDASEPAPEPEATPVVETTVESSVESSVEPAAKRGSPAPTAAKLAAPVSLAQAPITADVAPAAPSLVGFVGSVIGAVVVNVGSVALTALQAVEALASGPPVLPPGSTVTVRDSWITLNTGQRVAANWYYPRVEEGAEPPSQMILLSHGFLALGPMYSYTAATLAESTGSIVVTPTLPSNMFAGDSYWLGGTGMASAIADLFLGDRAALTQSALDASYATQYGLDPATAKLPQKFGLSGHSLGGNLVTAAAGFLAENGAAEDLVGVVTLDGVPTGSTMTDALRKLDEYEALTDHYIPIREIGAPSNLLNSLSNVKEALTAARPDRYNGVVLTGGVHMDSMRGGNPLIQFSAYIAAGFPQPQNPPAVDALAAQWFEEWFAGYTDIGDDFVPGSTIDVLTPQGTAHAVVIGTPPAAARLPLGSLTFQPSSPTDIPEANATLASLVA